VSTISPARSRLRRWGGVVAAAICLLPTAPIGRAAADNWCATKLGGTWDSSAGVCAISVLSHQGATMNISIGLPAGLIDDPTAGPAIQSYTTELVNGWHKTGQTMVRDSIANVDYQVYSPSNSVKSIAFHELFRAEGALANNAYRTYTFDLARGRRLQLADLFNPGVNPLKALPPLVRPLLIPALDQAPPRHEPGSYPFIPEKWEPQPDGSGFSGNYRAFALTPDELILYMPDEPMTHENPPQPGEFVWSMDGGTATVHVPRAALTSIMRPI
jgi:Protein of unknown function (DUF3298)